MRTLLFDIDGTLLMTNGGGQNALKAALSDEFQLAAPKVDISFAGRTDRSLLAELLTLNRLSSDEQTQGRLRRRYASLFPSVLAELGGRVLPGVTEILSRLAAKDGLRIGVMTGNLPETATRKLEHFDLIQYVDSVFGGDMDDHRNELARRAIATLVRRHGQQSAADVVVIGDTPADVRCGHVIGARVVAVCTGFYSRDELEAENPAAVFDDFSDVEAVCDILTR
jgi:phosphoglycolate phosphatase